MSMEVSSSNAYLAEAGVEAGTSSSYTAHPRHSWWSMLTTSERKLTIFGIVASTLAMVFLISTIAVASRARYEPDCVYVKDVPDKVCSTDVCIDTAHYIRMNMDEKKQPCDDFHAFACGNIHKIHEGTDSNLVVAELELQRQTKQLLAEKAEGAGAISQARHLYQQCLKQGTKNAEGIKAIADTLKDILQVELPMAVGTNWNSSNFNWKQSLITLIKNWNKASLLQLQVLPSPTNSSKYIPYILPSSEIINILTVASKYDVVKEIICLVYEDCINDGTVEKDIQGIVKLFADLTALFSSKPSTLSGNDQPWIVMNASPQIQDLLKEYTIKDLEKEIPEKIVQEFLEPLPELKKDENFKIATIITILKGLVNLLEDNEKPENRRVFANVIGLSFIINWGSLLSHNIRTKLNPGKEQADLCVHFINEDMGYAVGKMYIDKYQLTKQFEEVGSISHTILVSFRELINEASWMDVSTRTEALKKLDNMKTSVGMPEWVQNEEKVNEYYKEIKNMGTMEFVDSFRVAEQHRFSKNLDMLSQPVDKKNDWILPQPVITNAFYDRFKNSIGYALGMIKNPVYVPGRPRAIKFGTFGYIAGHEITHGFDSIGRNYDEVGRLRNWWSPEAENTFTSKAKCFIDRYSNITDPLTKLKLNGVTNLPENIADSGGLRAAFKAFKSSPAELTNRLKGLEDYTEDQLFFISAAQIWCSDASKEMLENVIKTDTHAPAKYRAIVPFQNDPEFYKAFRCEKNSYMNPEPKCQLW